MRSKLKGFVYHEELLTQLRPAIEVAARDLHNPMPPVAVQEGDRAQRDQGSTHAAGSRCAREHHILQAVDPSCDCLMRLHLCMAVSLTWGRRWAQE